MDWLPIGVKRNSIHLRLLATYLLLIILGTSLTAGQILWSFHAYFMKTRQADLENWSSAINETVADAMEEEDFERVELLVQRYGAPETGTLRVFSPTGQLLATSNPKHDRKVTDWFQVPGVAAALQNQVAQGVAKGVLASDDRLYVARSVFRSGRLLGALRMSITLERFQRQFKVLIWTVLGTLVLPILLCTLISEWFARSLSRPIQTMRNFAIRMGGGHFGDTLYIR